MAHFKLAAGADLEMLTDDELGRRLDKLESGLQKYIAAREGKIQRSVALPFTLNASGDGNGLVYSVPTGFHGFLHRITLDYPGSNASTPQSCDVRIMGDDFNTPTSFREIINQLPNVYSCGNRFECPYFGPGETIHVVIVGGPASVQVYSQVQVELVRGPESNS